MSLNTDQKAKKAYPVLAKGSYPARVVQIIDLGVQHAHQYPSDKPLYWTEGGKQITEDTGSPVLQPKVFINFEFTTELFDYNDEEKPFWVGKEFTISNDERSNLYALMESAGLDPTHGNVGDLLGLAVMASVGATSGGKAKIVTITPVPKGLDVPNLYNETVLFDLDAFNHELYESLPDWLSLKIDQRVQKNGGAPPSNSLENETGMMNDDIPF